MRDTVSIRDLSVSAVIGVYDWEREVEQTLVFGVDMAADVARAAATDAIEDALDYSAVAGTVKAIVTEGKFQLIETAAERVAERLLADYRLGWVRVSVAKPLPGEGYTAAITIERGGVLSAATGSRAGHGGGNGPGAPAPERVRAMPGAAAVPAAGRGNAPDHGSLPPLPRFGTLNVPFLSRHIIGNTAFRDTPPGCPFLDHGSNVPIFGINDP